MKHKEKIIKGKFESFWKEAEKENKKLVKWMIKNYGERCKEYYKGCVVCEAWRLYDKLKLLS